MHSLTTSTSLHWTMKRNGIEWKGTFSLNALHRCEHHVQFDFDCLASKVSLSVMSSVIRAKNMATNCDIQSCVGLSWGAAVIKVEKSGTHCAVSIILNNNNDWTEFSLPERCGCDYVARIRNWAQTQAQLKLNSSCGSVRLVGNPVCLIRLFECDGITLLGFSIDSSRFDFEKKIAILNQSTKSLFHTNQNWLEKRHFFRKLISKKRSSKCIHNILNRFFFSSGHTIIGLTIHWTPPFFHRTEKRINFRFSVTLRVIDSHNFIFLTYLNS